MVFQDRLYGEIEIKDNIILDMINSKAVQRLKNIDQAGYYFPYGENYNQITRFEDSRGCFYLLISLIFVYVYHLNALTYLHNFCVLF